MSLPRTIPMFPTRSNALDSNRTPPKIQAESFSRKPHAAVGQLAAAAAQTPLKPLAAQLRHACAALQHKLIEDGVRNPAYLGLIDGGGLAYLNPETGEVGIRHIRVEASRYGNSANYNNVCLVKTDGHVIFNGKTLTRNDPDLPKVQGALSHMLNEVANDRITRNSIIGGNLLTPPWEMA